MAYTQVITPNLQTVGDVGWCLAFVEKAYNDTNYSYATAYDGWQSCRFIHTDRNLPSDVMVPIWFSYYENGINYGHVAINVSGRGVLSSPYKADNTQQWFASIDECAKVLNCKYLGWSEDLMGVRVVTPKGEQEPMPNDGDVDNVYLEFNNRKATDDEKKVYREKTWSAGDGLYYGKVLPEIRNLKQALTNATNGDFVPVTDQLYKKK